MVFFSAVNINEMGEVAKFDLLLCSKSFEIRFCFRYVFVKKIKQHFQMKKATMSTDFHFKLILGKI